METAVLARPCKRGHTAPRPKGAHCKECVKAWQRENPDRVAAYRGRAQARAKSARQAARQPKAERRESAAARGLALRAKNRRYNWRAQGIDVAAAEARLAAFSGRCECCGADAPGKRGWCVDHDHGTGTVRGILCTQCNVGIGALGDTAEGLHQALAYLARSAS